MRELAVPLARALEYRQERLARDRQRPLDLGGMIAEAVYLTRLDEETKGDVEAACRLADLSPAA